MIFKKLSSKEEAEYRLFARNNYDLFSEIPGYWHPVIQDECVKMNLEKSKFVKNCKNFVNEKWGVGKKGLSSKVKDNEFLKKYITNTFLDGFAYGVDNLYRK